MTETEILNERLHAHTLGVQTGHQSTGRSLRHLWSIPDKASQNAFQLKVSAQTDKPLLSYGLSKSGLSKLWPFKVWLK
jgi:hypothetical protein